MESQDSQEELPEEPLQKFMEGTLDKFPHELLEELPMESLKELLEAHLEESRAELGEILGRIFGKNPLENSRRNHWVESRKKICGALKNFPGEFEGIPEQLLEKSPRDSWRNSRGTSGRISGDLLENSQETP